MDEAGQLMLREIVKLDRDRILTRLRSRNAQTPRLTKDKGKPLLLPLLDLAVNHVSIVQSSQLLETDLLEVRIQTAELRQLSEQLEDLEADAHQNIDELLVKIIQKSYEVHGTKLTIILETSRSHNESLKQFLPMAVGKIGRYYSINRNLVSAARAFPELFSRIAIRICPRMQPAKVDPGERMTCALIAKDFGMLQELDCLDGQPQPAHAAEELEERIQGLFSMSSGVVAEKVQQRMESVSSFHRVHAEIQLLHYYETHPETPHPRVISSSKSACYLCDLFFRAHTGIYLPRTHGRMYDKWMLPDWQNGADLPDFEFLVNEFSRSLDVELQKMNSEGDKSREHPNESVLKLYDPWPTLDFPNNAQLQ